MSEDHDPIPDGLNNQAPEDDAAIFTELNLSESSDPDADLLSEEDTHRGGFGEFGGVSDGLIDRTFRERIVLVGMVRENDTADSVNASLDELALLVDSAGADAVERVLQRRTAPDPATFVGSGKVKEIKSIVEEVDCDTVVFDDELSPAQQFNLEKILGCTALDRTAVILDIFAQNASTLEGKAQVELAQLRYRLPRLRSLAGHYSQQAGGIGTRDLEKPNLKWIDAASFAGFTSLRLISVRFKPIGSLRPRLGVGPGIGLWRSSVTPMPASRRY